MRQSFEPGKQYTRSDIYRVLGVPKVARGGDWNTGLHRHGDDWFLFCTIGAASRTGHQYDNHLDDRELHWSGPAASSATQPRIRALVSGQGDVYVFFRKADRAPFTFAGCARVKSVERTIPVRIVWEFLPAADLGGTRSSTGAAGEALLESKYQTAHLGRPFGSPEHNRLVEGAAIGSVRSLYCGDGWACRSVERDRVGYDLHCWRGTEEHHVEVKGLSGDHPSFPLTAGELARAQTDPAFRLVVVLRALSERRQHLVLSGPELLTEFDLTALQFLATPK
jgi:hypothetical protein